VGICRSVRLEHSEMRSARFASVMSRFISVGTIASDMASGASSR
jgi:hypothetical protein